MRLDPTSTPVDRMRLGDYEFLVEVATFRYVTQSSSGPGWDFCLSGPCTAGDPAGDVFPYGARLLTEAAPLPFEKAADYVGVDLTLAGSFDEATGEPFFGLNVNEEHEVSDVRLRFLSREGGRYLISFRGTVAGSVTGRPEQLDALAWVAELPDQACPA